MAKKKARKPSGAAGMAVIEGGSDEATNDVTHESTPIHSDSKSSTAKPGRKAKVTPDHQSNGSVAVSDIKKAAAFANSIGGLDKAIAVLQILKVARQVQ